MLFAEFFPRLQTRAWERYGQSLTERQFRDWVEVKLVPGPADPVGQGRGRSPLRHWPKSSYRRALRICRYKNAGVSRSTLWLIGIWLGGNAVDEALLRKALYRELVSFRRENRTIGESRRWHEATFDTPADIERNGYSGGLLRLFGISAEQFRQITMLSFKELNADGEARAGQLQLQALWNLPNVDELGAQIQPRSGLMADYTPDFGAFIYRSSPEALESARELFWLVRMQSLLGYGFFVVSEDRTGRELLLLLMRMLPFSQPSQRTHILTKVLFELSRDEDEGRSIKERVLDLKNDCKSSIEFIKERVEALRAEGRIGHLRGNAIKSDIDRWLIAERAKDARKT